MEEQIQSAETSEQHSDHLDSEDPDLIRRRQSLQLSRSRVLQQLALTQNPRHREMLNQALADLESQLARLN